MSNYTVLGTCNRCGGEVRRTFHNMIVGPQPPPSCVHCGAIPRAYAKPVIDMVIEENQKN